LEQRYKKLTAKYSDIMQQVDQPMINLETLSQVRKTISIKREIRQKDH
jgi:hypothetical protein